MEESRRERLRRVAERMFPEAAEMPEAVIEKLNVLLEKAERLEAMEARREEPIWKRPEALWKTIASIVSIGVVLVGVIFGYAKTTSSVDELRDETQRQGVQIAQNREEAKADLRNLESRLDRNLSGVNDKLDRLLLFLTENASRP